MEIWDPIAFKTLLRTTSQRLGQLQERIDSQGKLTRRDIATYLSQGDLPRARAQAATLIQDDVMADLLEELEMLVGTVGNRTTELGLTGTGVGLGLGLGDDANMNGGDAEGGLVGKPPRFSSALIEAAASVIRAAPSTNSKDLNAVREVLIHRLGPAFAQASSTNRNNHVSPRVMQILSSPPPTASRVDEYLANVAQTYGVNWVPEPRREDLVYVVSEILSVDAGSSPIVDLPRLREICARGLVDDPPWVRPRIWRLLFGTLPILKTTWAKEKRKQRDSYYDLVRRLLAPFDFLPVPTDPLSPTDALLARISDSLFRVSSDLFVHLGDEPKSSHSGQCPLDPNAPDAIRIQSAFNLDKRLIFIRNNHESIETPEIRLESDVSVSSDLASTPPSPPPKVASRRQRRPTTLLPSKAYNAPPVHRGHLSALLRLLYIHSTLNPAVQSPHVPWLVVPLYSALAGETDEDEVAHAEADTFWLFEALVGEIVEMEEEEGGKAWMHKLSERIKWADGELATTLHATGLDPVLPHYSYRWLAPLLTQTLPLSSVFLIWDAIFARPARARDSNPKLEHLVDICTALLVRARMPLSRLGKPGRNTPGLWTQEHTALPPLSPLRPWELSDAFTEGIALLTSYPIDAAGGIDRILQTAADLAQKRIEARDREKKEKENVGFGARLTQRMWKGLTNQVTDGSPEEEMEEEEEEEEDENDDTGEHDDGDETETPAAPTLTSRFATTVWRGITNQSSMDDEVPSPPSPLSDGQSPLPPLPQEEKAAKRLSQETASSTSSQTSLWDYAGKLTDSDTIAAFSKVSTNWRAKALDAWRVRKGSNASVPRGIVPGGESAPPSATSELAARRSGWPNSHSAESPTQRRGSLPGTQRGSEDAAPRDPPRPAVFRNPRESFLPQPRRQYATAPSSPNINPVRDSDSESATSFIHRAGASLASLKSFQPSHNSTKSVPRPLMLSAREPIMAKTSTPQPQYFSPARSEGATPEYRGGQWSDVLSSIKNGHGIRQESVSSTSSLAFPEATNRSPYSRSSAVGSGPRSDYESDGSAAMSRKVPLNRKSVSPMALASRSPRLPWNTSSPGIGVDGRGGAGHPLSSGSVTAEEVETASERGWRRHLEERDHLAGSTTAAVTGTGTMVTGLDSPTTIASPPVPHTPLMSAVFGPGVRIVNGGSTNGGGHVGTSSISTLSETSAEPPTPALLVRKRTPSVHGADRESDAETLTSESEESGYVMEMEQTPSGKGSIRIRAKRYVATPRPLGIAIPSPRRRADVRTPSPNLLSLAPDWMGENESATTTPKMENYRYSGGFGEEDVENVEEGALSGPPFVRKMPREARTRKVSTGRETGRETRRTRDSDSAEEGDDEGYDDLLSAYESEEGSRE